MVTILNSQGYTDASQIKAKKPAGLPNPTPASPEDFIRIASGRDEVRLGKYGEAAKKSGMLTKTASKTKNAAVWLGNKVATGYNKTINGAKAAKDAISAKTPQAVKTGAKYTGIGLAVLTTIAGLGLASKEAYDKIMGKN